MAFWNNKKRYRKRDKYTNIEKVAYNLGVIENVIKNNKDCRVRDSYLNGKNGKKDKKPLH